MKEEKNDDQKEHKNDGEGFEESEDEHQILISKENPHQMSLTQNYFAVPDPNPLLSKNLIEINKPKVLIREIEYFLQPECLLSSNVHKQLFSMDKPHNQKTVKKKAKQKEQGITIWNKYIKSQNYQIHYLKFFREKLQQLKKKGVKKFKLQLFRLCNNDTNLFSTYMIDLSFLSDYGSYLLQNLKPMPQARFSQQQSENIVFDSQFESGNLFAVFQNKLKPEEPSIKQYDLVLQTDVNTKGYSNWFYFSIKIKNKCSLKFNIINMQKIHSLFTAGMKVAVYSFNKKQKQNIQWHRDGYNYSYYPNQLLKVNDLTTNYNTLTFTYDVKYDNDLIFFAANVPYSYSKLLQYIDNIEKVTKLNSNIYFKKQNVAMTISSNQCPILTLTWKRDKKKDIKKTKKKIIGVIARQHPSQTVSSYVMEGFINSLVYLNNQAAVQLLKNYIFKIVPMVNIDGVIYGNSRCDLSGTDINRKWVRNPNKFMYPVIFGIRNVFNRLKQDDYQFDYFIDLHGHSRQMGSFIYGCKTMDQLEYKELSWILSRLNSKFIFESCSFGLSAYKRDTARGIMSDLAIRKKSFTLQTSFYGYRTASNKHFEIKDLHRLGSSLIQSIYAQRSKDPKIFNWSALRDEMKEFLDTMKAKKKDKRLVFNGNNDSNSEESSDAGSDSDPEIDEMNQKEKADFFLDPTVATKIGLNEVKVIDRKKIKQKLKQEAVETEQNPKKYQRIVDGFTQKLQQFVQKKPSLQIEDSQNQYQQKLKKSKNFQIRETKSVTKILPFKFTERPSKQKSLQKKSRKSVELVLTNRPQKLSIPEIARGTDRKNNFWSNLKKEYEVLVQEKKINLKNKQRNYDNQGNGIRNKIYSIQYL